MLVRPCYGTEFARQAARSLACWSLAVCAAFSAFLFVLACICFVRSYAVTDTVWLRDDGAESRLRLWRGSLHVASKQDPSGATSRSFTAIFGFSTGGSPDEPDFVPDGGNLFGHDNPHEPSYPANRAVFYNDFRVIPLPLIVAPTLLLRIVWVTIRRNRRRRTKDVRRTRRALGTVWRAVAGVSAIMCGLTAGAWVASLRWHDVRIAASNGTWEVASPAAQSVATFLWRTSATAVEADQSTKQFVGTWEWIPPGSRRGHETIPRLHPFGNSTLSYLRDDSGTGLGNAAPREPARPAVTLFVAIPHWCLVIAAAALPLIRTIRTLRRQTRRLSGRCARCGYDLRASPGMCPECGRRNGAETGKADGTRIVGTSALP
jgi:hypothetical protein